MGLPDQNSARSWGGRLLVDRDGTEIGTCTQIFVDDATGLPEWAQADLTEGPAVIPLMDAAESGDRVRVRVSRAEVTQAPPIDDLGHISPEEEERLYRHYGITYSSEGSESLLPVDEPAPLPAPEPTVSQPVMSAPEMPEPVLSTSPDVDLVDAEHDQGSRLRSLAAGIGGVLAAGAAAVFWWRLRHQTPPTRKELLAARAREAALALTERSDQVRTAAGPLMQTGRKLSSSVAQQAAVQAKVAAERAAVQARAASEQAAAVAAAARTVRLQRVTPGAELEAVEPARQGRGRLVAALQGVVGFAAGYALRGLKGGASPMEGSGEGGEGQRRQLQQVTGRLQTRAADSFRTGKAQVSQRAGVVASRMRSRSSGAGADEAGTDDPGTAAR